MRHDDVVASPIPPRACGSHVSPDHRRCASGAHVRLDRGVRRSVLFDRADRIEHRRRSHSLAEGPLHRLDRRRLAGAGRPRRSRHPDGDPGDSARACRPRALASVRRLGARRTLRLACVSGRRVHGPSSDADRRHAAPDRADAVRPGHDDAALRRRRLRRRAHAPGLPGGNLCHRGPGAAGDPGSRSCLGPIRLASAERTIGPQAEAEERLRTGGGDRGPSCEAGTRDADRRRRGGLCCRVDRLDAGAGPSGGALRNPARTRALEATESGRGAGRSARPQQGAEAVDRAGGGQDLRRPAPGRGCGGLRRHGYGNGAPQRRPPGGPACDLDCRALQAARQG